MSDKFKFPTENDYNPDSYEGYEGTMQNEEPPAVGPKWAGIMPGITSAEVGTEGSSKAVDYMNWNDSAPTHGAAQSTEGDSRGKRIGQG